MSRKLQQNETVQVVVRCRPMSDSELRHKYPNVIEVDSSRGTIVINNPKLDSNESKKTFTFDAVFDESSTQEDIYETVRPLVSSVLLGFNGTIFAYGQTGTGKTHTMEGSLVDQEQKGIILRSFDQIFTHIGRSENHQFLVRTSYLEIYQEEIRDLLSEDSVKCEIHERTDSGVYIKGLSSIVCKTATEIADVMAMGNECRSTGTTNMNEHSSRSHAILTVTIEMIDLTLSDGDRKCIRVGKLNLVDLAGSERQGKSGAAGDRLKEAAKINLSLSALGNVISALVNEDTTHIPYRDSKLTRLLQDSLGGNSNTVMVANIGPASYNYEESLTTLRYANRAKNIKNKPVVNEDPKDALIRQYRDEITRLKARLLEKKDQPVILLDKLVDDMSPHVVKLKKKRNNNPDKRPVGHPVRLQQRTISQVTSTKLLGITVSENLALSAHIQQVASRPRSGCFMLRPLTLTEKDNNQEAERAKCRLAEEEKVAEELERKIKSFESKVLCGGKNIIDHTNEQQRALEQQRQEIAEKKRTEVLMRQRLERQEDAALEIQSSYSNLHQEVDVKTKKLKKVFVKFQTVKQEIQDVVDEYNRDRRELELTQNELLKELKAKSTIIENFIPMEFKKRMLDTLHYSDELDDWTVRQRGPDHPAESRLKRPVSVPGRRPRSDYGQHKYKTENLIEQVLEVNVCSTVEYELPTIAPKIQAVLHQALQVEDDLDIDASKVGPSVRYLGERSKEAEKTRATSGGHLSMYVGEGVGLQDVLDMCHTLSSRDPRVRFPKIKPKKVPVIGPVLSTPLPTASFLPRLETKSAEPVKPARRKSAMPATSSKHSGHPAGGVKSAKGHPSSPMVFQQSYDRPDGPVYPKARGLVPKK